MSATGVILKVFQVSDIEPVYGCVSRSPVIAFDGVNYLVVLTSGTIFGTSEVAGFRVSTSGTVLDPAEGFTILQQATDPAIVFDGSHYLMVAVHYDFTTLQDIVPAKVSPDSKVVAQFPIVTAPWSQVMPAVTFDGVNYLVVWSDSQNNPPVPPDANLVGTG